MKKAAHRGLWAAFGIYGNVDSIYIFFRTVYFSEE